MSWLHRTAPAACVLLLAACASTPPAPVAAPGRAEAGVIANCTPNARTTVGPYIYENNTWGSDKARDAFEQCLVERERDGRKEIGWTWNWPGFDPSVYGYPEIIFGWKPWSGGASTHPRLPIKVTAVKEMTMRYEVETRATGAYNLAPEIWLTDSGEVSEAPRPTALTTEIMFWMDYKNGARPAGSVVDTPEIEGVKYELWRASNIGNRGDGKGWTLYSFKSPTPQHKGEIKIHALLAYMLSKNLVSPQEYVASIEFGNEMMGGTGTTWVRRFEIEVK